MKPAPAHCSTCSTELSPEGFCLRCALTGTLLAGDSPKATGREFAGYELLEEIGQDGAMGAVYRARDKATGRLVALKMLRADRLRSAELAERFRIEVEAAASLDHPQVLPVYDAKESHGQHYYTMKLASGGSLAGQMAAGHWQLSTVDRRQAAEQQKTIARLLQAVAAGVQHAHERGVLHRDLKPGNILLDEDGTPYVSDFGLAKLLNADSDLTRSQGMIGTPAYMAPEQCTDGGRKVTARTDVWALGAILYELLTGEVPFKGSDPLELLEALRTKEPVSPNVLNPLIDRDLALICLKCLEKDPARRYASAGELALDLGCFLGSQPINARPPTKWESVTKWWHRNPVVAPLVILLVLALLLGSEVSLWQAYRARRATLAAQQQAIRADANAESERQQRTLAEISTKKAKEALASSLIERAEQLTKENANHEALAFLARAVRLNPDNRIASARIVSLLERHNFPLALAADPGGLANRGRDSHRLDLKDGYIIDLKSNAKLSHPTIVGTVEGTYFSSDEEKMAVLTKETFDVFLTHTGEPTMNSIPARHSGSPPFGLFTPDNRYLLVGAKSSGDLEIWDTVTGISAFAPLPHPATVSAMSLSDDGRLLAAGVRNGEVRLWNLRKGQSAGEPCPGNISVYNVAVSSDGTSLGTGVSSVSGGKREFWDIRLGQAIPVTLGHPASVSQALYSPDAKFVATVCIDGTVRLWNPVTGEKLAEPSLAASPAQRAAFTPDSKCLALGGVDGVIGLWDLAEKRIIWERPVYKHGIRDLVFSPDGRLLIGDVAERLAPMQPEDWLVAIIDRQTGKDVYEINDDHGSVMSLDVSPDSRRLAMAYRNHTVSIWDLKTKRKLGEELTQNNGWVWQAVFSHDGKLLATSSGGDSTQLWNALTPTDHPLRVFPQRAGVHAAAFSDDDKLLITSCADHTSQAWNVETGKPVTEPLVLPGPLVVGTVSFRSGCREALTTSASNAVIWDVKSGKALFEPFGDAGGITNAHFSPDGRQLLVSGIGRTVKIHSLAGISASSPDWLPDLAEAISRQRVNEDGVLEYIQEPGREIQRLRNLIKNLPKNTPLQLWGNWYLSDRSSRTINPGSTISVKEYARQLASTDELSGLNQAVDLDPTNPLPYSKLSHLLGSEHLETESLYGRISESLRGHTNEVVTNYSDQSQGRILANLGGNTNDVAINYTAPSHLDTPAPSSEFYNPLNLEAVKKLVVKGKGDSKFKGRVVFFGTSKFGEYLFLDFSVRRSAALALAFRVADNPAEFTEESIKKYVNKTVIVEGQVILFKGQPEIHVSSLKQLKVVD